MILSHSTRIAVRVIIDDDTGQFVAFLLALTTLITMLIKLAQFVSEVVLLVNDFVEATHFTSTVFIIGFKSVAYGVGMRL
ncbi:MAG: hypothetical protein BroJett011_33670 [Chloroflexota bacterium]|nr:MAG: hypothetical protein BroJett011_33670 [Chloroflexota bacterium]